MKKAIKIALWSVGSLVALVAILLCVALFLLTPKRLTPIVNAYATQYLNATVHFNNVEVSLFEHFPQVSLKLLGADVVSHALGGQDTLLRFDSFAVSLDAWKLMSGKVSIKSVEIYRPWISALVDSIGRASWDIIQISDSSDSDSTSLELDIRSININGEAIVELRDVRDSTFLHVCLDRLAATGHLSNDVKHFSLWSLELIGMHGSISSNRDTVGGNFSLDTLSVKHKKGDTLYRSRLVMPSASLRIGADTLLRSVSLNIDGGVGLDGDTITLDRFTIGLGDIASTIHGMVIVGDSSINSRLSFVSPHIGLKDALALVPSISAKTIQSIHSNIALGVDVDINGSYNFNSGSLPDVSLSLSSPNGYLYMDGVQERLDRFELTSTLKLKGGKSSLTIDQLEMQGSGISLSATATVSDLMGDPDVNATANGRVSIDTLLKFMPVQDIYSARGAFRVSMGGQFKLSQLNIRSLARTTIWANLDLERVDFQIPLAELSLHATGQIQIGAATNKRDTIIARGTRVIGAYIALDTMRLSLGADIISGSKIVAWANTAASRYGVNKVKVIHPFNGTLSADRFTIMATDSSRLRLRNLNCNFNVTPSKYDPSVPLLRSTITARSLAARSDLNRYVLQGMCLEVSANVVTRSSAANDRRKKRLDSLQNIYPDIERTKLFAHDRKIHPRVVVADEMSAGDVDLKVGGDFLQLLRRWSAKGKLSATKVRIVTPYLPLRTEVRNMDINFDNNTIGLNSFSIHVGRSRININGYVSNLRQVLAGRGVLKVNVEVVGDTIDISQIISATNAGAASIDKIRAQIDNIGSGVDNEEQMDQVIAQNAIQISDNNLIIIPENIDLDVAMSAKYAIYGAMMMDSLSVNLASRNRVLQIKGLTARSNLGQMSLDAVYSTRSMHDISTGFDIELKNVQVDKLIDMMPSVDTMLPMLASFEGQVDCKFAAKASIDSSMNIIIPTLDAAGSISGRNLVLLDGETFTEISKIMRFKNRKRNIVDSISVQMLVRNSVVEIFPFILEIDRYKTAVSGVQKLDMSFDYHISVIKSIIPFRLGVNIFGNLDHWDFKLVKAKYKNENLPSYVHLIDTTRINLRHEISNIFR